MLIAEFAIKISGNLNQKELLQLDPHLDDMAIAIQQEAEVIFRSKLPSNLEGKVKLSFEE